MSKEFESKVLEFIDISKNNFDRIENKVDGLESKVDGLESKVDGLESKVDGLENKVYNLQNIVDKQINNLNEKFEGLNKSVILIENKVMTEFPALFEAFEIHQELHKDYDEKMSYLSVKTEENSIKISALEDKTKFM